MRVMRNVIVIAGICAALAQPAAAVERKKCLSVEERKLAVAAHKVVPLGKALRAAKARTRGDVVRARLCEQGQSLVYLLTVLGRDGKVMQLSVDAGSGTIASGR